MASREQIALLQHSLEASYNICSTVDFDLIQPAMLSEAAFALLMINLKDALITLDRLGARLTFSEDLPDGVDVTKQIAAMRDAICHIGSPSRHVNEHGTIVCFGMAIGQCKLGRFGGVELENPYQDDIAVFYGKIRLLLKRHVFRALDDALLLAPKLAEQHGFGGVRLIVVPTSIQRRTKT